MASSCVSEGKPCCWQLCQCWTCATGKWLSGAAEASRDNYNQEMGGVDPGDPNDESQEGIQVPAISDAEKDSQVTTTIVCMINQVFCELT